MRPLTLIIILAFVASAAGGIFIFRRNREIVIENAPIASALAPSALTSDVDEKTSDVEPATSTEEIIAQAQALIEEAQKFIDEEKIKSAQIAQALEKSSNVKGIYTGAVRNFNYLKGILEETELDSLVIDIKETNGLNLSASLKKSISEFHQKDIWAIARIVIFRDSSLIKEKPGWYLFSASTTAATSTAEFATTTNSLWQDKAGQYWLDPQNEEVRNYIIEFSKKAIDYGFDELQFDYIRYPDDYDYISGGEKIKVMGDFFSKISSELRSHKPSIILSVDLFGYVATQFNSYEIGQRLIDAGQYFDYLSFMLYPSHFYGGFSVSADSKRQIPAVYLPYKDDNVTSTSHLVSSNPYKVVSRSIFSAIDYLDFYGLKARVRPWLQDFDLKVDTTRGIFYDAEKVRSEISAAEDAGSSGWLLWNPSYIYTREALPQTMEASPP